MKRKKDSAIASEVDVSHGSTPLTFTSPALAVNLSDRIKSLHFSNYLEV